MMNYWRGWCPMELAYSDILRSNLGWPGGRLLDHDLPLFFLREGEERLSRTVWNALRDRGRFHHPPDGDCAKWAAKQIVKFLHSEQALALNIAKEAKPESKIHDFLKDREGLVDRVTRFDPAAIP
jgi:hypothetical protein